MAIQVTMKHLIALLMVLTVVVAGVPKPTSPRRDRDGQEYGIGFDFTPSYGAVAISFANGSNIALGRVDGDRDWHRLMFKIAVTDHHSVTAPDDVQANGLILVDMVQKLLAVGNARLGWPIRAATVTLPCHNRVHHDGEFSTDLMVRQAFAVADPDLEFIKILGYTPQGEPLLFVENSILAGHKLALCEDYTSDYTCGGDRHYETYFLVGYYDFALEVTLTSPTWTAYGPHTYPYPNYDLGVSAKARNEHSEYYWQAVNDHLTHSLMPWIMWDVSKVVIYGDHAGDSRLRSEVTRVMDRFHQAPKSWSMVEDGMDPAFVGAMGAAEFVKRQPYAKLPLITAGSGGLIIQP